MSTQDAYPLAWPDGWPRTPSHQRERGQFDGTPDKVRRELVAEIDRLVLDRDARTRTVRDYIVVSTNMPLRADGEPMAGRVAPADPGVAVYFQHKKKPMVPACDKYDAVWKNMRGIQRTIEALRGIERWGSSQLLERAFRGFTALPERTGNSWCDVLKLPHDATAEQIRDAYRRLAMERHPDQGGSHEAFVQLQQALQDALRAVGGAA